MSESADTRTWYVAYASNLALERLRYYLRGGPVPGGARTYPGCRDPADPVATAALMLPGRLVFAGRSTVWGGGIAFYDRGASGAVAGRGYLLTTGQVADLVAQETRQPPGGDVALAIEARLRRWSGRATSWEAAGLYDTLVPVGDRDGVPLVTITSHDVATMAPTAPAESYLRWIRIGLHEAHGWNAARVDRYLASAPGIASSKCQQAD